MTSTTDPRQPAPRQAVVLRHDTPDGGSHFDLLFEDPARPAGRGALIAFRVAEPPAAWPAGGRFELERMADHRRVYLDYEGEISGGRGRVTRVERFAILFNVEGCTPTRFAGELATSTWSGELRLARASGTRWRGECLVK